MKKTATLLTFAAVTAAVSAVELPLPDGVARAKAEAIRAKMTLGQKVSLLGGCATMYLKAYPELGIPREWAMSDCSHSIKPEHSRDNWPYVPGVDHRSVVMPPLSAVAMTWNPDLAARHGTAMGEQMRALGKDQLLGPGVNIMRTPLCGRNWEYMTEDPFLAARLVVPYVRAVQKLGVATTVKHFCVNNQELARHSVDTLVDERTLHEIYLPAFEAAVREGGSICLMTSYNRLDGVHTSENAYLLRGILREQWGFRGMIVTDWGGQHSTVPAALNGANVEMDRGIGIRFFTDYFGTGGFPLLDAVTRGEVPESNVDDMVGRVLFAMAKTGFLDGVQPKGARFTEAQRRTQVEIGEEAITLLKNDRGVLPLSKAATKRVVVLGLQSDLPYTHLGSSCEGAAERETTAFAALREYLGDGVEVKLLPLGDEAVPEGEIRPIPPTQLETVRGDSDDAFVRRGWEVLRWNPGDEWTDRTVADGFADYPTGRRCEAVRYRAKVRAPETGTWGFAIAPGAHCQSATVKLDGRDVFSSTKAAMTRVDLVKDRVYTVIVDVSGCSRTNAFNFGWARIRPEAGGAKLAALNAADAVIVFTGTAMGRGRARECEGADLPGMEEPSGHDDEIAALVRAKFRNVVVVNRSGTPLEMPWADACATLLQVPYLGQDSAALPRVLFGDVNPSGRLACTFPRRYADTAVATMGTYGPERVIYNERFYVGYRWHDHAKIEPRFPFGRGLSYTTFSVGAPTVPKRGRDAAGWSVAVPVANTGKVAGKHVVQLYMRPLDPKVERCEKELKGFAKTRLLKPGESETVTICVSPRDLAFYDTFVHRWVTAKGRYALAVGTDCRTLVGEVVVEIPEDIEWRD